MSTEMGQQVDLDNREEVFEWLGHHVLNVIKVAELTGLARNSIYVYSWRPEMEFPEPIAQISSTRCKFWWRQDVLDWIESRRT
jgi:predicted DNA-binding transcriptional regulator AlpA